MKIYYTIDDIIHRYFPDLYIKSINKIIEVKSSYTYNYDLEKNLLIEESCKKQNLNLNCVSCPIIIDFAFPCVK